jgi:predicted hydrolase (HD superfamily)
MWGKKAMMDRDAALELLREPGPEPHLIQHALASEAVLRALAAHFGEDAEVWGLAGLLHDWDYPLTAAQPARHGLLTAERCASLLPEDALHAIRAHNAERNGCPMENRFDIALSCGETVTGMVIAAALVRPTGMEGMQPSSLKKKMKDRTFAAAVNRDAIRRCADMGLELDAFLALAIGALAPLAGELGCAKG